MKQPDYLAVTCFQPHDEAEAGIEMWKGAGLDSRESFLNAEECNTGQHVARHDSFVGRIRYWGESGAIWGGILGCLLGAAFYFIPGLRPAWIGAALTEIFMCGFGGAVALGGLSTLAAGIYEVAMLRTAARDCGAAQREDMFLRPTQGAPK